MTLDEVRPSLHKVKPYPWLQRNLTVVMQGQYGMHDILVVREPGYNGERVNDGLIVFSEVQDDNKNEVDNRPL